MITMRLNLTRFMIFEVGDSQTCIVPSLTKQNLFGPGSGSGSGSEPN